MTLANIIKQKKDTSNFIKSHYNLLKKHKVLGLVSISDIKLLKKLIKSFEVLDVNFVVITSDKSIDNTANISCVKEISPDIKLGFDFIICDHHITDIQSFLESGVTPILQANHPMISLFSEFNPMISEGNSYIYDKKNPWIIFATLVRYLENHKFIQDNKNLIKNVLKV